MRAALLLTSVLALAACNMSADAQRNDDRPRGPTTQRSYNLTGFTGVSLAGSQDVIVRVGPAHSVRADGEAEMLDRLDIQVEGGSLRIGMKKGNWMDFGSRSNTTIHVTLPTLEAAAIAGSGDMRIDRVEGNRFSASVSGSGDLSIEAVRVADAEFAVTGSGAIRASGNAQRASSSVTGSGDMDLGGLETGTAAMAIVGSGDIRARVMQQANVSIMGSGDVSISGPAKCSVTKKGSGDVRCEG
jgi:hypothetical protein